MTRKSLQRAVSGLVVAALLTGVAFTWIRRVPADIAAWRAEFKRAHVGQDLHLALDGGLLNDAFRAGHSVAFEWDLPHRKPEPDDPRITAMRFRDEAGSGIAVVRIQWVAMRFRN